MRIIKFRSWDNRNKVMDYPDSIANGIDGEKYQIMQYTGLRDKGGVEIFEGDIVKFKYARQEKRGEIAYGLCGFWIIGWLDILEWKDHHQVEVIGNIYSNPELLT